MEAELSKKILDAILTHSNEGIVLSNVNNEIQFVNNAFTQLMGYPSAEIIGKNAGITRSGLYDESFYTQIWQTINHTGYWAGELSVRRKSGEIFFEWVTIVGLKDPSNKTSHFVTIFSDITEKKTSAERIYFLTNFDALTHLPNLNNLYYQLENTPKEIQFFTFFYIDLDKFKNINNSFSLSVGDKFLQIIAERLNHSFIDKVLVARAGGDKFVVVVPGLEDNNKINKRAATLLQIIREPIQYEAYQITLTAAIGISLYSRDGKSASGALKDAEAAMYQAKQHGRDRFQFFNAEIQQIASQKLLMENNIRRAIHDNSFELYFHPIVNLKTGFIQAAEALIRWKVAENQYISPDKFIYIAEDSGLIIPLTEWVLETVCQTQMNWLNQNFPIVPIAVNIPSAFFEEQDFIIYIEKLLKKFSLNPIYLKLEITESNLIDADSAMRILHDLKSLGLHFSIDDFGTGYSSLSYLKSLPVDDVKIDQSFIRDIPANKNSKDIVTTILNLAKKLKLNSIAEGVETKEQLEFLRENHCDFIQGYYFNKPAPASDFVTMLKNAKKLQ